MTPQVNFDTIKSEIVTEKNKERRKDMDLYEFIKAFFHVVEPGLDDAFDWIDENLIK